MPKGNIMMENRINRQTDRRAFTLIELLIVIAIIAILALIAVPNFLEAQVRAKITRAMADQRTIATAVEAYSVDWGRPPLGNNELKTTHGASGIPSEYSKEIIRTIVPYVTMSTPVAYLSTVPVDYFCDKQKRISNSGTFGEQDWYRYDTCFTMAVGASSPPSSSVFADGLANGTQWYVFTLGPSQRWAPDANSSGWIAAAMAGYPDTATSARYPGMFYDATNGTMSYGLIVRSNKGGEPSK